MSGPPDTVGRSNLEKGDINLHLKD